MSRTLDRLVILGLDGATWSVLDPMIERGVMPNLAALKRQSRTGDLTSTVPPVTSAAWTTMQTGCTPARHGVFDHRHYDLSADRMRVNHSGRVRVPTVWHELSNAGRSIICLNVPVTYPAPRVRGLVVSGMDAPHLEAATASAPWFRTRLQQEVPDYSLQVAWRRAPQSLEELKAGVELSGRIFSARAQAAELADRVIPDWSILMVQFQNLDPFQHRVWPYLNVDQTGLERPGWNSQAEAVLTRLDDAIGRLCSLAAGRGASVLALSDHGFGPCQGRIHVNRVLVQAGVARSPSVLGRFAHRRRQAFDRLQLWSAKRDDPSARAASFERSIAGQFPLNWKRTLGFAPHQDTAAMIYLNRRTEFRPQAPIAGAEQAERANREISDALLAARCERVEGPLFEQVIPVAETYGVDPAELGYPDLIAMPREDYWIRSKLTPGKRITELDPNLPGTHRPQGVVMLQSPGVPTGTFRDARLMDITPTILHLFGLPAPSHVEGCTLVRPGVSIRVDPRHRSESVPTTPTIPSATPPLVPTPFEHSEDDQALIEKRLAELGYLE